MSGGGGERGGDVAQCVVGAAGDGDANQEAEQDSGAAADQEDHGGVLQRGGAAFGEVFDGVGGIGFDGFHLGDKVGVGGGAFGAGGQFAEYLLVEHEGAAFVGLDGLDRLADEADRLCVGGHREDGFEAGLGFEGSLIGEEGGLGIVGGHRAPAGHAHLGGDAENIADGFEAVGVEDQLLCFEVLCGPVLGADEEAVFEGREGVEEFASCGDELGPRRLKGCDGGGVGGAAFGVPLVVGEDFCEALFEFYQLGACGAKVGGLPECGFEQSLIGGDFFPGSLVGLDVVPAHGDGEVAGGAEECRGVLALLHIQLAEPGGLAGGRVHFERGKQAECRECDAQEGKARPDAGFERPFIHVGTIRCRLVCRGYLSA